MTIFPKAVPFESLRHFLNRSHHQQWFTRVFSAACMVLVIGFLEGKGAAIAGVVWLIGITGLELWAFRDAQTMRAGLAAASEVDRDAMLKRVFMYAAGIAAFYTIPVIGLSFGSQSGQVFGLILCVSILMNIATQHVIHHRLIYFSLPFPALGFLMCATALAGDNSAWIIGVIVVIYLLQTALLTRTATRSYAALIGAQHTAIVEATARGAADSANQTKSNFLANMSHELRTPLNAVLGYGEILKENAEFENRPGDIKDIDKVLVSANRLLGLVEEILDMSKIEAGGMVLVPTSFDLADELKTAIDMVRPTAAHNGNRLATDFDPQLGTAVSDPLRFSQCILNLMSNAVKFTKDGQITVSASRRMGPKGEMISICVTDTGIGVPHEKFELIFQPFAQGDETSTRRYGGTGLGLSLTRSLARLMGGDVTVSSEVGKGSRFEMTILANLPPASPSKQL